MKDNKLFVSFNIQRFAENETEVSSTETEQVETTTQKTENSEVKKTERMYTRAEVEKIKADERKSIEAKYQAEKSEAEKLAKMDADQKLNYENEQLKKENEILKSEKNAMTLQNQANTYATEKNIPLGYIEDWDYAKETAETIKEKIDKLAKVRSADLDGYLKEKLKQPSPKAVDESGKSSDPYLDGFKNYMKNRK